LETLEMADNDGQAFVGGAGQADPIAPLLRSVADAWGMGLQAWQVLAGMGASSQSGHPGAVLAALVGAKQNITKSSEPVASRAAGPGGAEEPRQATVAQMADISPTLAEACMVGAASAMRYWGTLAELGLRYEASLAQTVADRATGRSAASPAEIRVRADELRAFLRGVGDAANLEARRLQLNLERVGETIAEAADQATPSPHPYERRRRHEVKP
jgi:hypothetical protein